MSKNINLRNPGIKRLLKEAAELNKPTSEYHAHPLDENIFEWHFTIRGPSETTYQGGIYHGRIIFPNDYPMKPPAIIILTPNGRFEINQKICLSVSSFHPEQWQPCWGVRTILLALIGFFPSPTEGAVGSTDISDKERKRLALISGDWECRICKTCNKNILLPENQNEATKIIQEAKSISSQFVINPSTVENESTKEPSPNSPKIVEPRLTKRNSQRNSNPLNNGSFAKNPESNPIVNSNEKSRPWSITSVPFRSFSETNSTYSQNAKYHTLILPLYDWVSENEDLSSLPNPPRVQYESDPVNPLNAIPDPPPIVENQANLNPPVDNTFTRMFNTNGRWFDFHLLIIITLGILIIAILLYRLNLMMESLDNI